MKNAWGEVLTALTGEELDDFETYYHLIEERDAGRYHAPGSFAENEREGSCGDTRLDALAERAGAQAQTVLERILNGDR